MTILAPGFPIHPRDVFNATPPCEQEYRAWQFFRKTRLVCPHCGGKLKHGAMEAQVFGGVRGTLAYACSACSYVHKYGKPYYMSFGEMME